MTDIQLIKDRIDVVQLIQEYVPLKKAGVNWKANCPFHQEKSPSFMVHPEKQIWHCFGCGKGGDIFSFVQEIEGLDFVETLKLLAPRAGVVLTTTHTEINQSQRNRLLEINAKAAYFFHHFLLEIDASQEAREYLKKRGVIQKSIIDWQIGYVANQWDLLTRYLLKKGFSIDDIVGAGLTIKREGADRNTGRGYYDRFRGRIMFPITDVHGNVLGFTGRVLVETEQSGGKYVNSPQTIIYDKSRILYGLYQAKTAIKAEDRVILVEGQMDVISCHQIGMKNVVAASGTALTPEQIKLIKRYTNNLAIAFDADSAGENAGKRGVELAVSQGLHVEVIQIPRELGKDADECIHNNLDSWVELTKNGLDIMEWYFRTTVKKYNLADPKDRQMVATVLLTQIARLPYGIERDHWLKKLGETLQVDDVVLREEMKKIKLVDSFVQTAKVIESKSIIPLSNTFTQRYHRLLEAFWALLRRFPSIYEECASFIRADYFTGTVFFELYGLWQTYYNNGKIDLELLAKSLIKHNSENIVDVLILQGERDYSGFTPVEALREGQKILQAIHEEWVKKKRKDLELLLRKAEEDGNEKEVNLLLQNIQSL